MIKLTPHQIISELRQKSPRSKKFTVGQMETAARTAGLDLAIVFSTAREQWKMPIVGNFRGNEDAGSTKQDSSQPKVLVVTDSGTHASNIRPERQCPGDPTNRSTTAYEPTEAEIKFIFKDNPSSLWVITPTRIIERKAFFRSLEKV